MTVSVKLDARMSCIEPEGVTGRFGIWVTVFGKLNINTYLIIGPIAAYPVVLVNKGSFPYPVAVLVNELEFFGLGPDGICNRSRFIGKAAVGKGFSHYYVFTDRSVLCYVFRFLTGSFGRSIGTVIGSNTL